MSDAVAITNGELSATIAPLGAELLSLTDAQGREYMSDADPRWWTGHAPLLFPIVGGLSNDRYRLGEAEYTLPRHGFARRMNWELAEASADAVTFRLRDTAETRAAYPFAFVLSARYALEGNRLSLNVQVENPGDGVLPFSLGFHPAFAWPLPGGGEKLAHAILFEREEPAPIRRLDAEGLVASSEESPVIGKRMPLDPSQYEADAMIWDRLESRFLSYVSPEGPRLDIAFPELPMLGIWQKPGANFICIEPWAGIADPAGYTGNFLAKPGVMQLAPGEERSFRMDVSVFDQSPQPSP